jgi:Domain of unknown function (DUF4190)
MAEADPYGPRPEFAAPAAQTPDFVRPPVYPGQPEYSVGAAPVPPPPMFSAPDPYYPPPAQLPPGYPVTAPGYPVTAPPSPGQIGYGGYSGYGGYGMQPPMGYPVFGPPQPKTNGLAIASLVVSAAGAVLLICYGAGGVIGAVGAILGHVARRQVKTRQEAGGGMALAGVIVGWIAFGLGIAVIAAVIGLFAWLATHAPTPTDYSTGYNAAGTVLRSFTGG